MGTNLITYEVSAPPRPEVNKTGFRQILVIIENGYVRHGRGVLTFFRGWSHKRFRKYVKDKGWTLQEVNQVVSEGNPAKTLD